MSDWDKRVMLFSPQKEWQLQAYILLENNNGVWPIKCIEKFIEKFRSLRHIFIQVINCNNCVTIRRVNSFHLQFLTLNSLPKQFDEQTIKKHALFA